MQYGFVLCVELHDVILYAGFQRVGWQCVL